MGTVPASVPSLDQSLQGAYSPSRAVKGWETVSVTIVKKWGLNNQYEGLIVFKKP